MAEPLRGLPVAFATAQRARLEELIGQRLEAYPPAREYGIVARPVLQVAEVTYVTVLADSTLYRARLEARINLGTQAPAPDLRAQLGRAFGSLEPYVLVTMVPSNLALQWQIGLRFEVGSALTLGAETSIGGGSADPYVTIRLSPDVQIRGTYTPRDEVVETRVTYRLNEVLSWEGVATSRGLVWLRMVSNL
jgi:hypothetical protein